jgi:protein disulfide-isomerase A6
MASDWEKLAADWAKHPVGLVAEIDCTDESAEPLCERFGVEGFPTLKYGDPSSPDEYQGGRDYDSLSTFAKENIAKPVCSVSKMEACDKDQKKILEGLKAKSKDDLLAIDTDVNTKIADAQKALEDFIEEINQQYEVKTSEFQETVKKIQADSNHKYVKQVLAHVHGVTVSPNADKDDDDTLADEL